MAYPKLTAFGEAFRLNGYQISEDDDVYVKEDPVSLGAEAYKRVFPDAVWPGAIPAQAPVGFRVSSRFEYRQGDEDGGAKSDFIAPDSLSMLLGGTLGEDISFYGDIGLFEEGEGETDVGRLFVQFNSLFDETLGREALNLKIGRFEPSATPFSSHRRLGLSNYGVNAFTLTQDNMGFVEALEEAGDGHDDEAEHSPGGSFTDEEGHEEEASLYELRKDFVSSLPDAALFGSGGHHGSGLSLGRSQSGIELNGVLMDRLFYAGGLVNGNGVETSGKGYDNNTNKDYYGRLAYKFGGMPLTGESSELDLGDSGKNWRDDSLRLGVFAYLGDAQGTTLSGIVPASNAFIEAEMGDYQRFGADFSWFWKDLNLFGAFMHGRDEINLSSITAIEEDEHEEEEEEEGEHEEEEFHAEDLGLDDHKFNAWFVEADYVLKPWLIPYLRYDAISRDNFRSVDRIVPGAVILVRANMKVTVESQLYPDDSGSNVHMVALDYAF